MAGIARNTKEDIVNSAFEIVKEKGVEGLNAREVAKRLNCSIQPIFYQFATMEELKKAVYEKIYALYKEYMLSGENTENSYRAMGKSYVRFAKDYPVFFKILFMQQTEMNKDNYAKIDQLGDKIIETGRKFTGLIFEEQKEFHLKVWIFTHGIATLIVTGTIKLNDNEIDELIGSSVRQMLIGYKKERGENKKWKISETYYGE